MGDDAPSAESKESVVDPTAAQASDASGSEQSTVVTSGSPSGSALDTLRSWLGLDQKSAAQPLRGKSARLNIFAGEPEGLKRLGTANTAETAAWAESSRSEV